MRTTRSVGCGIVYYNALDEDVDAERAVKRAEGLYIERSRQP